RAQDAAHDAGLPHNDRALAAQRRTPSEQTGGDVTDELRAQDQQEARQLAARQLMAYANEARAADLLPDRAQLRAVGQQIGGPGLVRVGHELAGSELPGLLLVLCPQLVRHVAASLLAGCPALGRQRTVVVRQACVVRSVLCA